jgi:phage terminase Nu1 subunit (DNA packaging protein)
MERNSTYATYENCERSQNLDNLNKTKEISEDLVKTKDLCDWLKISNATVMRWRNEGMPYHGKGRSLRYNKEEVQRWVDEQNQLKKEEIKGER